MRLPGKPGSKEFMAAYADALARSEPEKKPLVGERTVAHAASILTETMRWRSLAPSTRKVMALTLSHVATAHGHRPIDTLDRPALIRIRDSMADRPGAARNWLEVFRKLLSIAIDHGWRSDNPAEGIRLDYRQEPFTAWTWDDVQKFFDRHGHDDGQGSKARLACMLLLATGQRRSDVVRMGWQMVDGDVIRLTQTKTSRVMTIYIRPELRAMIDPLPREAPAFLMTDKGRPFTAAGFGMWFRDKCDAAGLEHLSAHGLRKLALTAAANAGATMHELQAIGGHASPSMVAHYTRTADDARLNRQAAERVSFPVRIGGNDV